MAISGDTVAVGVLFEDSAASGINGNQADNSAVGAGAAYVFVRTGSAWTHQAYLKASNTGQTMYSVAVAISLVTRWWSEPMPRIARPAELMAAKASNGAIDSGAAYVLVRSGSTWTQQAYLKASNPESGDHFGISVAISGDTVVVGAYGEDGGHGVNGNQASNGAVDSGAAYVLVRSGSTWTQQANLKASNPGAADFFGGSVAISGDTAVVGAFEEDSAATGVNGDQARTVPLILEQRTSLCAQAPPGLSRRISKLPTRGQVISLSP